MLKQPTLETRRLRLSPIAPSDTSAIQKAASVREIADAMITIPHPYPDGEAECYVARKQAERETGGSATYTIKQKPEASFCGIIELRDIDREHSHGELSFWLDVTAWGRGYMSEAVQLVVRYGFEALDLNRLYAYHMLRNPASGRILAKNGFNQEGLLRQCVRKRGQFEDVALWAILRQDWQDLTGD